MLVAMEEAAELQQSISKILRLPLVEPISIVSMTPVELQDNLAEEMADMEIMLEQLKILFKNSGWVNRYKVKKIERLKERVNSYETK